MRDRFLAPSALPSRRPRRLAAAALAVLGLTATLASPAVAATNVDPIGRVDSVTTTASTISVSGWALDPDVTTGSIAVHVYLDGKNKALTANISRPDLVPAFGMGDRHGFATTLAATPGDHRLCVYAINNPAGKNPELTCRIVKVAAATTPVAPLPVTSVVRPASIPGPSNTGVPAGTVLKVHNGDLTVTTAGTVVDSMDIRGYLRIKAPNVTVKNSVIRGRAGLGNTSMALIQNSSPGVVIQDSELVAQFPTYYVDGFVGSNATFTRVNVHGVVDSIKLIGDNVVVQDSWLHDNLYYAAVPSGGDTHNDNIQIGVGNNITIRNNVMTGTRNAVLMVTQDRGPVSNLTFTGNRVDNGACSINLAQKSFGPIKGVRITDNAFGIGQVKPRCAIIAPLTTSSISTITGNTFTDGSAFKVTRG